MDNTRFVSSPVQSPGLSSVRVQRVAELDRPTSSTLRTTLQDEPPMSAESYFANLWNCCIANDSDDEDSTLAKTRLQGRSRHWASNAFGGAQLRVMKTTRSERTRVKSQGRRKRLEDQIVDCRMSPCARRLGLFSFFSPNLHVPPPELPDQSRERRSLVHPPPLLNVHPRGDDAAACGLGGFAACSRTTRSILTTRPIVRPANGHWSRARTGPADTP